MWVVLVIVSEIQLELVLAQRVIVSTCLFGLSKNERPILDHHAKAHNFEIRRISHEIQWIS